MMMSFSRFGSERARKRWAESAEAKALGAAQIGVLGKTDMSPSGVDPRFLADIQEILMEAGASREMMDAVWQRWLETLPDQSLRTSRIHRKNRMGFDKDAFAPSPTACFTPPTRPRGCATAR